MLAGDGDGHFRAVGVVIDGDVFDVGEVLQVEVELLLAEGRQLGSQVFMGEVAEGLWMGEAVPGWSLRC